MSEGFKIAIVAGITVIGVSAFITDCSVKKSKNPITEPDLMEATQKVFNECMYRSSSSDNLRLEKCTKFSLDARNKAVYDIEHARNIEQNNQPVNRELNEMEQKQ